MIFFNSMWLRLSIFVLLVLLTPLGLSELTQGFRLAKVRCDLPHQPLLETEVPEGLPSFLNQPFHYLGKGTQCFVFESADGRFVLKLFRFDRYKTLERIEQLFSSFLLAEKHLKKESALLFLHLNGCLSDLPTVVLKDPLGREHRLDLNRYPFALQEKVQSFEKVLLEAKKDPEQMKKRLTQVLDLLQTLNAEHLINTDPNLSRNFGFLEDRAVLLDFGSLKRVPQGEQEMKRYTQKLRKWCHKNAPEWEAQVKSLF